MRNYVVYGQRLPWVLGWHRTRYDPDIDAPNIEEAVKIFNEDPYHKEYYATSARCIMWSESWHLDDGDLKRMKTTRYWKKKKEMEELEKNNPHLKFSMWKDKNTILNNSEPVEILKERFYIYFLIRENEIVYIGQTDNFVTRLKNHQKRITFDHYSIQHWEGTLKEVKLIESQLILHHKPCENKNSK